MSKSFTYNIVVSRSAESIGRIFFDETYTPGSTTTRRQRRLTLDLLENLGEDIDGNSYADDLILTPFNNSEFISFETSIPGAGGVRFSTLRLLESRRILEKFIIPTEGVSDAIGRRYRREVAELATLNADILKKMKNIRPRYYIAFGVGDDVSKWAGPFCVDLIDANLSIREDGTREIELGFTPTLESLKIFTNKLVYDESLVSQKNIEEAKGTNYRILEVATDITCPLDGASPTLIRGQTVEIKAPSDPRSARRAAPKIEESNLSVRTYPKSLKSNSNGDRWNFYIRALIKKFAAERVQSISAGNVLVLFPHDLDMKGEDSPLDVKIAGANRFKDIISLYRTKLGEYGITISAADPLDNNYKLAIEPSTTDEQLSEIYSNESIRKRLEALRNGIKGNLQYVDRNGALRRADSVVQLLKAAERGDLTEEDVEQRRQNINKFKAEQFKLQRQSATIRRAERQRVKTITDFKERAADNYTVPTFRIEDGNPRKLDFKFVRDEDILEVFPVDRESVLRRAKNSNPDRSAEEPQSDQLTEVKLGFYNRIKIAEGGTASLNDRSEVLFSLRKFFRVLNEKTSQPIQPAYFEENDLRVTKLLEKHGLIKHGDQPVLMVGHLPLIQDLIYSKKSELPASLGKTFSYAKLYFTNYEGERGGGARDVTIAEPRQLAQKWLDFKKESSILDRDRRGRETGLTSSFQEKIDFGPYDSEVNIKGDTVTPDTFIFMHNMKNANVLDVSFDSSPYKGELLSLANEPLFNLIDKSLVGNQTVRDNTFKFNFEQYLETGDLDKLKSAKENPLLLLQTLGGNRGFLKAVKNELRDVKVIDFLDVMMIKISGNLGGNKFDDIVNRSNSVSRMKMTAETVRRVNEFVINVNIRTIPFFNTSYYLGRSATLVGAPNEILGSTIFESGKQPPAIFTGKYKVFGYKHVMTPNDAYSEFTLLKDGFSPGNYLDITLVEYYEKELAGLNEEDE